MLRVKVILILILATVVSLVIPFISKYAVSLIGSCINGNSFVGSILMRILFYSLQTSLAVLFVRFVLRYSVSDMGFNTKNFKTTVKQLRNFTIIWLVLDFIFYFISINFISGFDTYISKYYVANKEMLIMDFIGGCLLAGVGEEPLFRGLVVIVLSLTVTRQFDLVNLSCH